MNLRWHDDILHLALMGGVLAVTWVIYLILRKRQPRADGAELFTRIDRWVGGLFFALVVAAAVFITFRYS